jgi:oligosaccharide repeat unit polymerase
MTFFFQKKTVSGRTESMPSEAKIRLPIGFSPINLTVLAAIITFLAIIFGDSISERNNLVWIVSTKHISIISLGFTALLFGLILPKKKVTHVKGYDIQSLLKPGRNLTILGIIAHVFFFGFHLTGITTPSSNGKLGTIAGITTLTQLLPVGLTALYAISKTQKWSKGDRNLFAVGVVLSLIRVVLNSERLALIELIFPVIFVYLAFKPFSKKFLLRKLFLFYGTATVFSMLYFSFFEYFRSWQVRKYTWSGNYLAYAFERLATYYSTSVNNGAIYYEYRDNFTKFPSVALDFIVKMPIIEQLYFSEQPLNYTWGGVLALVTNTDEFNNTGTMLTLAKDLSFFGMAIFFFLVGRFYKGICEKIKYGDFYSLLVLATTAVGFLELPRVQWWTLGRTFPIFLGLIYLHLSKKAREGGH